MSRKPKANMTESECEKISELNRLAHQRRMSDPKKRANRKQKLRQNYEIRRAARSAEQIVTELEIDRDKKRKIREAWTDEEREESVNRLNAWNLNPGNLVSSRKRQKQRYHSDPSIRASKADQHYRNRYGLSLEQYREMVLEQAGCCAICDEPSINLYVDHCHTTGRIRGLLCPGCNTAIGNLKESKELFVSAMNYLGILNPPIEDKPDTQEV